MECPWYDRESPLFSDRPPLWEIATDLEPFSFLRLSSANTDLEVGLIIARLIDYNGLKSLGNLDERLQEVINYRGIDDEEGDCLTLPGGLELIVDNRLWISPSCCCGLADWREWVDFLSTGEPPFFGHDRDTPYLELLENTQIRVCRDDSYDKIDRQIFELKLTEVQQDLANFLIRIETWARDLGFAEPEKLAAKFDRCFSISRHWDS
jgi:hypothetical protein